MWFHGSSAAWMQSLFKAVLLLVIGSQLGLGVWLGGFGVVLRDIRDVGKVVSEVSGFPDKPEECG